jgi:hypothetical protein
MTAAAGTTALATAKTLSRITGHRSMMVPAPARATPATAEVVNSDNLVCCFPTGDGAPCGAPSFFNRHRRRIRNRIRETSDVFDYDDDDENDYD